MKRHRKTKSGWKEVLKPCRACGVPWIDHKDVQPTCEALQVALDALRQIGGMYKRSTRAKRLALATVQFLETQTGKIKC